MTGITVRMCAEAVAAYYGVTYERIVSRDRSTAMLRPRHVGFWAAKRFTGASLPEIGRMLGGKDHSTVWHGCCKIEEDRRRDAALEMELAEIEAAIMATAQVLATAGLRPRPDIDPLLVALRILASRRAGLSVQPDEMVALAAATVGRVTWPQEALGGLEDAQELPERGAMLERLALSVGAFLGATDTIWNRRRPQAERDAAVVEQRRLFAQLRQHVKDLTPTRKPIIEENAA